MRPAREVAHNWLTTWGDVCTPRAGREHVEKCDDLTRVLESRDDENRIDNSDEWERLGEPES